MGRSAHVVVEIRRGTVAQLASAVRYLTERDGDFPQLHASVRTVGDRLVASGWWYKFPGTERGADASEARGMAARALSYRGMAGRLSVVPWDEGRPWEETFEWAAERVPCAIYTSFEPRKS